MKWRSWMLVTAVAVGLIALLTTVKCGHVHA